jgi:two-component system response regulator VicR
MKKGGNFVENIVEKEKKTILVVDDEPNIVDLLVFNLQKEGYDTIVATDGITAVDMALKEKPDLILLDVMIPRLDGISVCKKIRYALNISNIPILMISAKDTESDKIVGLEMGADDYITKPFQIREVMARIKANLRKAELNSNMESYQNSKQEDKNDIIKVGDLTLDLKKVEVKVKGEVINLTKKEFDVLKYLAVQPGQVVTREMLLRDVWEYEEYVGAIRTIDVTMNRIRDKIEKDKANPKILITKRGVGYYVTDKN